MTEKWKTLNNPPVVVAIFQILYEQLTDFKFDDFILNDRNIKKIFPKKSVNYHSDIGMEGTPAPGVSTLKAKANTHINRYTYSTEDSKQNLIIEEKNVRYTFEGQYQNWEQFKKSSIESLVLLQEQLNKCRILRTSIRFVNKFQFDEFNNPLDYFNTAISIDTESESSLNNPMTGFSFRFRQKIPDTNIRTVINHSLEMIDESYDYYFDIDALDDEHFDFDLKQIDAKLEQLRDIKNTIFFGSLKEKTIELCN